MTTSVIVVNRGPDPIKVEAMQRDAEGQFMPGGAEHLVQPSGTVELYVHSGQSLQVHEEKNDGKG